MPLLFPVVGEGPRVNLVAEALYHTVTSRGQGCISEGQFENLNLKNLNPLIRLHPLGKLQRHSEIIVLLCERGGGGLPHWDGLEQNYTILDTCPFPTKAEESKV